MGQMLEEEEEEEKNYSNRTLVPIEDEPRKSTLTNVPAPSRLYIVCSKATERTWCCSKEESEWAKH